MNLQTLKLTNFRNYSTLNFNFGTQVTVLIGDNAQGKTNFLESIYFLATAKSLKADRDEELITDQKETLWVEGTLGSSTTLVTAMQMAEGTLKKKIMVNGVPRRLIDYSGNLVVVLFRPEDINLVTGSPSLRRYYIDQTLSQIDREYKRTLSLYEGIITRKNKVLKSIREGTGRVDELTYWYDQQLLLGVLLTERRKKLFEFINQIERKFGNFKFEYFPSEVSAERLKEYQQKEIDSVSSLIGPHRDDFGFILEKKDLAKFGSRGEQRTAVLDLKLAEVAYIEKTLGDRPVLLLDDIFSELDEAHRQHVVDVSKMQQTVIATVEFDKYLKDAFKGSTICEIEKGRII